MSIEQLDVVDVISIDRQIGDVILTISDHLDWSDTVMHQTALQAKFNKYLAFVESGEIFIRYPDAKNRRVVIKVVFKYEPDQEGCKFLSRARTVIESAGFGFGVNFSPSPTKTDHRSQTPTAPSTESGGKPPHSK